MALVVTLTDAADVSAVGGKAASLGELSRAGVAVPPGYAVTTEAFALALAALDAGGELRAGIEALDPGDLAGIAAVAAALPRARRGRAAARRGRGGDRVRVRRARRPG